MRVNLKKLNAGEVKEQNQVTVRNKSGSVENSEDNDDVSRAWISFISVLK
jgi:hypothetical protein